jgi:hypothetical protein
MRGTFGRAAREVRRVVADVVAILLIVIAIALLLLGAARLAWLWLT